MSIEENQNDDLDMTNPLDRDEYSLQQANRALRELKNESPISFSDLPKYFDVDDTPIVVAEMGDEVIGLTWSGHGYPVVKAMAEGREIDLTSYVKLINEKMK